MNISMKKLGKMKRDLLSTCTQLRFKTKARGEFKAYEEIISELEEKIMAMDSPPKVKSNSELNARREQALMRRFLGMIPRHAHLVNWEEKTSPGKYPSYKVTFEDKGERKFCVVNGYGNGMPSRG